MKMAKPPLQFILVGLEPNQQGHAASQEQASSSWPDIFQEVFLSSATTPSAVATRTNVRRSERKRMGHLLGRKSIASPDQGGQPHEASFGWITGGGVLRRGRHGRLRVGSFLSAVLCWWHRGISRSVQRDARHRGRCDLEAAGEDARAAGRFQGSRRRRGASRRPCRGGRNSAQRHRGGRSERTVSRTIASSSTPPSAARASRCTSRFAAPEPVSM